MNNETNTSHRSFLFGVDAQSATLTPKDGGCEANITLGTVPLSTDPNYQIYQFVDRPYRGMSKVLTPTQFASLWAEGSSFHDDPPNTAVKKLGIGFNTVEITDVSATTTMMTIHMRKPTATWGGPHQLKFCVAYTGALTLFVDSVCDTVQDQTFCSGHLMEL